MQATWMRKGRGRMSIDRLLCLLGAVLLLCLVSGCRDEEAAETAGREIDQAVEMASEKIGGTFEDLGREVDEAVEEIEETAQGLELASEEAGGE